MLEPHRFRLTVLSPLHIGCGTVYTRMDFAHLGRTLFVIHEQKLARALARQNLLAPFLEQMEQQGRDFTLAAFLQRHRLHHEQFYRQVAAYTLPADTFPPELHAFIKTPEGNPYLPGSSLKGAFRTAVLYGLLKRLPEAERERLLIRPLRQKLDGIRSEPNPRRARQHLRRNLGKVLGMDRHLLQDFQLAGFQRKGPNTDLMRIWEIQDSPPLAPEDLRVYAVNLAKLRHARDSRTSRRPLAVEALKPGTRTTVTFTLNRSLWQTFQQANPRPRIPWDLYEEVLLHPLNTLREMTQDLLQEERQHLRAQEFDRALNFSQDPVARLGWGQGLLSTTLFLLLPEDLRRRVRNELFKQEGSSPAPLTRRLANGHLMGFVHLSPL